MRYTCKNVGKKHGTGIKSNMLQECRGVSDVAQNYTTQTGFRAVSSKKIFRSVHPALVYSTKVFETKTKENRNNKERIRRFQSKVQHIWWFLCPSTIMQNTLELIKQICPRLLVSPSFPDLVIHARATPTGIGLQLLRELSRSVCQILPGAPHHDLWELRWIGYLQYWKCAMPVCSRGALQQLTVLAQNRENHRKHIWCFPKNSRAFSSVFSRCLRFPMFFITFSPAFHPFFHRCSPTFPPWNSPFQGRSRGETSPAQRFHGCVSGYTTRSCESHAACSERIRKARNLWCGTFWIIGHDWSLKVWMDSIQVVWYESTFWIDMTSLEHI